MLLVEFMPSRFAKLSEGCWCLWPYLESYILAIRGHILVCVSIWYSSWWSVVVLSCFWCINEIFDVVEMEKINHIIDYGDVIYDQPDHSTLSDNIESVQYDTALAITGAIRGTSRAKLHQELGLKWGTRIFAKQVMAKRLRLYYFHKILSQNYLPIFMI